MEHSEQINEIAAALAKAQGAYKPLRKDKVAKIKMKAGGEYSYKYSDLADLFEATRPALSENGLAVLQSLVNIDRGVRIATLLMHASGQWLRSDLDVWVGDSDPRTMGSATTYGRRYAVAAMLGIASDDDDDGGIAGDRRRDDREERQPEPRQQRQSDQRQPSRQQPAQSAQPAPEPRNIATYISLGKKATTTYGYTRDEVAAAIARALPTGDEARAMSDADYSKLIADLEALERRALQEGRGKQIEAPAQD